jgi:hypothetical protein
MLWKAFLENPNLTKKTLYFIFNEQNEYEIDLDGCSSFGFEDIYRNYPSE